VWSGEETRRGGAGERSGFGGEGKSGLAWIWRREMRGRRERCAWIMFFGLGYDSRRVGEKGSLRVKARRFLRVWGARKKWDQTKSVELKSDGTFGYDIRQRDASGVVRKAPSGHSLRWTSFWSEMCDWPLSSQFGTRISVNISRL
jgi:hypothetical protein